MVHGAKKRLAPKSAGGKQCHHQHGEEDPRHVSYPKLPHQARQQEDVDGVEERGDHPHHVQAEPEELDRGHIKWNLRIEGDGGELPAPQKNVAVEHLLRVEGNGGLVGVEGSHQLGDVEVREEHQGEKDGPSRYQEGSPHPGRRQPAHRGFEVRHDCD